MHLAYLILAHKNPSQLQRLVGRLSNEDTFIFIHLDKKAENNQVFYNLLNGRKNVFFIEKQVSVSWGAFSMIEATLAGLSEILRFDSSFDRINLLSGMDYPIKSNTFIRDFFNKNQEREFLYYRPSPSPDLPLGGIDRYEYYYDYDNRTTEMDAYEIEMKAQGKKRPFIPGYIPYHGTQWWSLTSACAGYVLQQVSQEPELLNFYRYTKFSDEQFFQTIIMNSGFAGNVINDNLRYIDWSNQNPYSVDWKTNPPHPKTLTKDDYLKLRYSTKLFARKFDENTDRYILDYMDSLISPSHQAQPARR